MATKEDMVKVGKILKDLLTKGDDWATLTINGLTIQKLPARLNKSGSITKPSSLALVFNPIIDGKQARKGIYFHNKDGWINKLSAMEDASDLALSLLDLIGSVNPNTSTTSKPIDSDYTFDL